MATRWCSASPLVNAAALLRAVFALTWDDTLRAVSLMGSGALWSLAFAFFVVYWPILSRPRADGRPG